jgi:hypothetical protein
MSWSEEFGKLSLTVKKVVVSVALSIPFWFVSIYLFNKPLFNGGNYYVILSFCFCFALTWYFTTLIFAVVAIESMDEGLEGDVDGLYLSGAITLSYVLNLSFIQFLLLAYLYVIIRIIIIVFFLIIQPKKKEIPDSSVDTLQKTLNKKYSE